LKYLELYYGCKYSFLEITFPCWPYTVLYKDQLYDEIRADYIIPDYYVKRYRETTNSKIQATDAVTKI